MTDRDQIIEAMAKQYDDHMLGENWGDDGVGYVGCDCGLWFGKASECGWDLAKEHVATAALDAALPLIREAFAKQVRSKALGPDFGRNPMSGADSRDARLYGAYDDGLECAARLIEGVEL